MSALENLDPKVLKHVLAGNIIDDKDPGILQILGLGSCVAVTFYHAKTKMGIMAHVVLPARDVETARTPNLKGKYANMAVEELVGWTKKNKIPLADIEIKLTGGAKMFKHATSEILNISDRNIESVKEELAKYGLKPGKTELGGSKGRSIFFFLETGEIKIYHAGSKLKAVI